MLVLFVMMAAGFIAFRRGIFGKTGQKEMSALIVRLLNPFLMISSILAHTGEADGTVLLENLLMVSLYYALLIGGSFAYVCVRRLSRRDRCLQRLMLVLSNIGFLGIPVVRAVYGPQYVLYVVFYMLFFNVLAYTYGIFLAGGLAGEQEANAGTAQAGGAGAATNAGTARAGGAGAVTDVTDAGIPRSGGAGATQDVSCGVGGRFALRRIVNIGTVSSLVAILLFIFRPPVPVPVQEFCTYMGNACIPLSMILIGGSLAQLPLGEIFRNPENYLFTAIKMLVIPSVGILLFKWLPFAGEVKSVFYLMLSMPVASLAGMLAEEYGRSGNEVNKVTAMTTLVSVLTIPLLSFLY